MFRIGFPVYNRAVYYRHPVFGYSGAIWLAKEMANVMFTNMKYRKNKEWVLNIW
jgi:Nitrogenase molybdenum-iron protein, alpha and beta chains